jgi:putative PIN family toxin of toxin-antitoxin system
MQKENRLRIILDTNLWISFLISKKLKKIDTLFENNAVLIIFSQELLEEFIHVARRPKLKKYFSESDILTLLDTFEAYGEMAEVISIIDVCRDSNDNFLLALAKDSNADFLITGDQDLLIIKKFEHTLILSYSEFELKIK